MIHSCYRLIMKAKDFPLPYVEIRCDFCGRFGRYSKARFCEIVGDDTELPVALTVIAKDCPEDTVTAINMRGNCRPYYPQDW